MKKIILASTSPRRKELLEKLGIPFSVVGSNYQEKKKSGISTKKLVEFLALQKAKEVSRRFPENIVIGADTLIMLGDKIIGKPKNSTEAKKILSQISGKTLKVFSGIAVIRMSENKIISKAKATKVSIKKISKEEIIAYIKTKEPLDKAGAFAIQGLGAILIKKIEGDFFNAVGLSLFETAKILKEDFDLKIL